MISQNLKELHNQKNFIHDSLKPPTKDFRIFQLEAEQQSKLNKIIKKL